MLSGIFAISLYDEEKKMIYLIRDALGVKPLYFHFDNLSNRDSTFLL